MLAKHENHQKLNFCIGAFVPALNKMKSVAIYFPTLGRSLERNYGTLFSTWAYLSGGKKNGPLSRRNL